MFYYSKIPRNLYRTCMNYVHTKTKTIATTLSSSFFSDVVNIFSHFFGYNEFSLSNLETTDPHQKKYNIQGSSESTFFSIELSGLNSESFFLKNSDYSINFENINNINNLSGSNTEVQRLSALQTGITDVLIEPITNTNNLSGSNTEVQRLSALQTGITDITSDTIINTNNLSGSNTEVQRLSALQTGITDITSDTIINTNNLSGSNTEVQRLSALQVGITDVLIESITNTNNLSGSNTEVQRLSALQTGITDVLVESITNTNNLSGSNTEVQRLSALQTGITTIPIENGTVSYFLSNAHFVYENIPVYEERAVIPIENGTVSYFLSNAHFVYENMPVYEERAVIPIENGTVSYFLSNAHFVYENMPVYEERAVIPIENGTVSYFLSNAHFVYENIPVYEERAVIPIENGTVSYSLSVINSVDPNYLIRRLRYTDTDATNYIAAVESADGVSLEPGVKDTIIEFVAELKKANLWSSISDCLILAGARTLNGALIPLKGFTSVSSTFTPVNYNRKWVQGNEMGVIALGKNNNDYPSTNFHTMIYLSGGSANYIFGDGFGSTDRFINLNTNGSSQHLNSSSFSSSVITSNKGVYGLSRANSSNYQIQFNFNSQNPSRSSGSTSSKPLFLFKAGSSTPFNGRISFISMGSSLDMNIYQGLINRLIHFLNAYVT